MYHVAAMTEEAFVEADTEYKPKPPKTIRLPTNEDGSINWESTPQKHIDAFINAVKIDPNGILKNIKEEAGSTEVTDDEPSDVADATVLTCINLLMVTEAIGVSLYGPKHVPVLRNLPPVVAIKACTVSMEEIQPVMAPAKRIIKRYIPLDYLTQEFQDIFIVGEHLLKMSIVKFKQCVALAMQIEQMKNQQSGATGKPNGSGNVIDAEFAETQTNE